MTPNNTYLGNSRFKRARAGRAFRLTEIIGRGRPKKARPKTAEFKYRDHGPVPASISWENVLNVFLDACGCYVVNAAWKHLTVSDAVKIDSS